MNLISQAVILLLSFYVLRNRNATYSLTVLYIQTPTSSDNSKGIKTETVVTLSFPCFFIYVGS
jgi:hypothetical protein